MVCAELMILRGDPCTLAQRSVSVGDAGWDAACAQDSALEFKCAGVLGAVKLSEVVAPSTARQRMLLKPLFEVRIGLMEHEENMLRQSPANYLLRSADERRNCQVRRFGPCVDSLARLNFVERLACILGLLFEVVLDAYQLKWLVVAEEPHGGVLAVSSQQRFCQSQVHVLRRLDLAVPAEGAEEQVTNPSGFAPGHLLVAGDNPASVCRQGGPPVLWARNAARLGHHAAESGFNTVMRHDARVINAQSASFCDFRQSVRADVSHSRVSAESEGAIVQIGPSVRCVRNLENKFGGAFGFLRHLRFDGLKVTSKMETGKVQGCAEAQHAFLNNDQTMGVPGQCHNSVGLRCAHKGHVIRLHMQAD